MLPATAVKDNMIRKQLFAAHYPAVNALISSLCCVNTKKEVSDISSVFKKGKK